MDAVTFALAKKKAKAYTDSVAATKANLVNGKVPSSELPSYVDDVVEYANVSAFPATGESGKIYVALDTNYTYRWSGTAYVRINEVDLSAYRTSAAQDVIDAGKMPNVAVTSVDDGKVLTVSNGVWVAGKPYNLSDWAEVARCVKNGDGAQYLPVGTLLAPSCLHSTWGNITWQVAGHNLYPKPGDATAPTMTILSYYRSATNIQFDASEAMYYADTALAAGSYTFQIDTTSYYFTLTNAVPAGGQICLNATLSIFTVYGSPSSTTALETGSVSSTEISGATDLGALGSGGLNHWDRIRYGSNNYKESAIRQLLNSDESAGSVWTPQTHFDRPPTWASSTAGFVAGLPSDFLSVVGEVDVKCKTNQIYEAPDSTTIKNSTYTLRDKFYLASQREIYGSESTPLDGSSLFPLYDGASQSDIIKYRIDSHSTAGYWWLRTPYPISANFVRLVLSGGALNYVIASSADGCVPACTIY